MQNQETISKKMSQGRYETFQPFRFFHGNNLLGFSIEWAQQSLLHELVQHHHGIGQVEATGHLHALLLELKGNIKKT